MPALLARGLLLGVPLLALTALGGCAGARPDAALSPDRIAPPGAASVGGVGTASTGGSGLPAQSVSGGTGTGVGTQTGSALATTAGTGNGTRGTLGATGR